MADKKYGVEVVLEGAQSFLKDLKKLQDNLAKVGTAAGKTGSDLGAIAGGASKAAAEIAKVTAAAGSMATTLAKVGSQTSSFPSQIFTTVANAVDSSIQSFEKFGEQVDETEQSAAALDEELQNKPKDVNAVSSVVSGASAVFSKLSLYIGIAQQAISILGRAFSVITAPIRLVASGVSGLIGLFLNAANAVKSFIGRILEIGGGVFLGNLFSRIAGGLKEMTSETVEAIGAFQRLEIQLKTMSARDVSKTLGISVAEAMDMASERAQGLLGWIQKLAVETPYSADYIAKSFALANAYGIGAKQAQELTTATLDFTAAMGLEEGHMWRIIYNFGQMYQQGKLTGREFRDLAISFVPIGQILEEMGKEMNLTKTEMEELAYSGGVPVQKFFDAFKNLVDKEFKGSAKEMTKTLSGVINNFKDFFHLLGGYELWGPVTKKMAEGLSNLLQSLMNPKFVSGVHLLGETISSAFDVIVKGIQKDFVPAWENLTNMLGIGNITFETVAKSIAKIGFGIRDGIKFVADLINGLVSNITKGLDKPGKESYNYGFNFIEQFARGMAAGVKFILDVIVGITKLLAKWFGPGSPPRVAPKAPEWGANFIRWFGRGMADEKIPDDSIKQIAANIEDATTKAVSQVNNEQVWPPPLYTVETPDIRNVGDFERQTQEEIKALKKSQGYDYLNAGKAAGQAAGSGFVQGFTTVFTASYMSNLAKGWTSNLFDMFGNISDTVQSFFKSLEGIGMDEKDIVPNLLDVRDAIGQAINALKNGSIDASAAADKIIASMRKVPDGMKEYITGLIELGRAQLDQSLVAKLTMRNIAKADQFLSKMSADVRELAKGYVESLKSVDLYTRLVEESQARLTVIEEHYSDVLDELNRQLRGVTEEYDESVRLREIQRALDSQLLTAEEKERLEMEKKAILLRQQIRSTEDQRDKEVDAQEDLITGYQNTLKQFQDMMDEQKAALDELVQAHLEAAQEQVDSAKALIDLQTEQNNLIKEQIDLLDNLAKGGAGDAESIWSSLGLDEIPELISPEDVAQKIRDIMAAAETEYNAWKERMKTAIANGMGYETWGEMEKGINEKLTAVQSSVDTLAKGIEAGFKSIEGFVKDLLDTVNGNTGWSNLTTKIGDLGGAVDNLFASFGDLIGIADSEGAYTFGKFVGWVINLASEYVATQISVAAQVINNLADALQRLADLVEGIRDLKDSDNPFLQGLSRTLKVFGINFDWVTPVNKTDFKSKAGLPINFTEADILSFPSMVPTFDNEFNGIINDSVKPFRSNFESEFTGLSNDLILHSIVPDMLQSIYDEMNTKLGEIINLVVVPKLDDIEFDFEDTGTNVKEDWKAMTDDILNKTNTTFVSPGNIVEKITTAMDDIAENFNEESTAYTSMNSFVTGALDPLAVGLSTANSQFDIFFTKIDTFIAKATSKRFLDAIENMGLLKGESPSPLAIGIRYARIEMARFAKRELPLLAKAMNNVQVAAPAKSYVSTVNRNVTIQVDANYANTQSEAGIYWDITAALQSVRI